MGHAQQVDAGNVRSGFWLSWQASSGVIPLLGFYAHCLFASCAAHVGAMCVAFVSVAIACGGPRVLAAIVLGQLSKLLSCLATYGFGSKPPCSGAGYVSQAMGHQLGLLLLLSHVAVCLGIAGAWWRGIGLR
ncbi:hypothetical protein WJX81_004016 [Elliptochloris bilobata]|uniref:Uncharacterized protein n=1 Tax=Elliptochloris bilobata TaxID=381761 RepID=A0AAW1QL07_9CHLO